MLGSQVLAFGQHDERHRDVVAFLRDRRERLARVDTPGMSVQFHGASYASPSPADGREPIPCEVSGGLARSRLECRRISAPSGRTTTRRSPLAPKCGRSTGLTT